MNPEQKQPRCGILFYGRFSPCRNTAIYQVDAVCAVCGAAGSAVPICAECAAAIRSTRFRCQMCNEVAIDLTAIQTLTEVVK